VCFRKALSKNSHATGTIESIMSVLHTTKKRRTHGTYDMLEKYHIYVET